MSGNVDFIIRPGSPPPVGLDDRILLSIKDMDDGRWMGVVSCGGHPVLEPDIPCIVLDVIVMDTSKECEDWFAEALLTRPWERRQ